MSSRTRLVSVSAVSYKTGTRVPFLAELAGVAHRHGAYFCVDATQALGRVPVPLDGVDFLVSSSYKWLLGTHGLGITYIAPALRERLEPGTAGWFSLDAIFHETGSRALVGNRARPRSNPACPTSRRSSRSRQDWTVCSKPESRESMLNSRRSSRGCAQVWPAWDCNS